jgi:branched-chain amino acid aminotransferase
MSSPAWLNGRIVSADEPQLLVNDRGLQLGDGVFETLRARRSVPIELHEHLARLRESAAATALPLTLDDAGFVAAIRELLDEAGLARPGEPPGDAALRITLTRGPVAMRNAPASVAPQPTLLIQAWPYTPPPARVLEKGLRAVVSAVRHDPSSPLAGVKSTSRADSIFARLEAERAGADDAIYPTPDGALTEGTTASLFVIQGSSLITPPLSEGVLAGTTRTWLLQHGGGLGFAVTERRVWPEDVRIADEVLFTSSVAGILPLVALDGVPIGAGSPGPEWRRLRAAREQWIDEVSRSAVGAAGTAAAAGGAGITRGPG